MPASVASPYQALYRFNCSPLLHLPGSLACIIHRRASLFLIKKKSNLYIGGAKYFIAPSTAHCDWVVYASTQETNQWATGCSLSLCDGKKNKKHSVGPFSASAHRENAQYARLPTQPCWNLNIMIEMFLSEHYNYNIK